MSFKYNGRLYNIQNAYGKQRKGFVDLPFLRVIKKYIPKDSTVIDCGGNIGNHSIFFAGECGAEVHTFEPMEENYSTIERNCLKNDIHINLYKHALAARDSSLKCMSALPGRTGAYWFWYKDEKGVHPADQGYKGHRNVPKECIPKEIIVAHALDDCVNMKRLDFIKIDVEGMEAELLKGARRLIKEFHPKLYIEVSVLSRKFMTTLVKNNNYTRVHMDLFRNHHWLLV